MKTIRAQILATGDELSSGALVDTNSAYIAQVLEQMGIAVTRHIIVADDLEAIISALKEIGQNAQVAVVTGGLGPTMDDLSTKAAAKAANAELVLDTEALAWIKAIFASMGRDMDQSNKKQAYFPKNATLLPNPIGTAPGFSMIIGNCRFFFLPGVPVEMRLMLKDQVAPRINEMLGQEVTVSGTRTICTYGAPEAVIGERVEDIADKFSNIKVGLRTNFPQIEVKLYARGETQKQVDASLEKAALLVMDRAGEYVFSAKGKAMPQVIGDLLRKRKETLAIAESCTGGLVAHWITGVAGSSDYFLLSAVTYANEAKTAVLGVSPKTLAEFGAVHEQTVKEMAKGVRRVAKATYGLATSGIAGPGGGAADKPVGTVCMALATPEKTHVFTFYSPFGERGRNIMIFSMTALEVLRRNILGLPQPTWGRPNSTAL